AILLSNKEWSYDKSHLGSYKDYVPNHYLYGYFLTTYFRSKFGDLVLSDIANKATTSGWNPFSFYNAAEEVTGERFLDSYKNLLKELVTEWKEKIDELSPTPYEIKNVNP